MLEKIKNEDMYLYILWGWGGDCGEAKINALYVTKFMTKFLAWESHGSLDDKNAGIFYGVGIFLSVFTNACQSNTS